MSDTLRVVLFNSVGTREMSFRSAFEAVGDLQILREFSEWPPLRDTIHRLNPDMVAISLDDGKGAGLEVVQHVALAMPACGIIGVSGKTDPNTIIQAMRAGCGQFVCSPVDPEDLKKAVDRIRATRQVAVHTSKRVCVIGSSGGAGATMLACNLVMELAHFSDRRTALVDMNLEFGDVACAFDCTPTYSIADVCREGLQIDATMLAKALHELPCNVSILARPERIEQAREVSADGVQAMFNIMSSMFPYVVVDLPRAADYLNASAVMDADKVLIVTQLTVPFLRNATRIHKCLLDMGVDEHRIEIVLNRCKSVFERISPDDVETHFGKPLFAMIPNDYRRVQTALDFGHPIVADAPNTPARLAIQKMARLIAGEPETELAPSFFNRMLGRSKEKPAAAPAIAERS